MFSLNTVIEYAKTNNLDFGKEIAVKLVGTDCDDERQFAIHVAHSPDGQLGIIVKSLRQDEYEFRSQQSKSGVSTIRFLGEADGGKGKKK